MATHAATALEEGASMPVGAEVIEVTLEGVDQENLGKANDRAEKVRAQGAEAGQGRSARETCGAGAERAR